MDFAYLYGDTRGRISRKTWWLGAIGLAIIAIILNMVLGVVAAAVGHAKTTFGLGLFTLISLAFLFVPYRALTTKRLNDRGRPQALFWLFFAPSAISGALMTAGLSGTMQTVEFLGQSAPVFQPNAVGKAVGFLSIGVGLWALVELGFLPGRKGDNDHGPDPLVR